MSGCEALGVILYCLEKCCNCKDRPNCNFKQLARKTEDYIELEKRRNKAHQEFKKLKSELQAEKQKVKELQARIKEMSKDCNGDCTFCICGTRETYNISTEALGIEENV